MRPPRDRLPAVIVLGGATDCSTAGWRGEAGAPRLGRDLDATTDLAFFSAAAIVAYRAGRLPRLDAWPSGCDTASVSRSRSRRSSAAHGARDPRPPYGAVLRVGRLALCVAGRRTVGTSIAVACCCVPPRLTVRSAIRT
jgi:hypothetical protein